MSKKNRIEDMIHIGEVSKILGISKPTFKSRRLIGMYRGIKTIRVPRGIMFDIFDVFKFAHPRASYDKLEEMIRDFRWSKTISKKRRGEK